MHHRRDNETNFTGYGSLADWRALTCLSSAFPRLPFLEVHFITPMLLRCLIRCKSFFVVVSGLDRTRLGVSLFIFRQFPPEFSDFDCHVGK